MKQRVGLILATMVLGGMLLSGVVLAKTLGSGPNTYTGSNGPEYIDGGAGADDINGNNGDDKIFGGKGSDLLHGAPGNDYENGGPDSDTAWGDKGHDTLRAEVHHQGSPHQGSIQAAKIKGGRKPDKLLGGRGNDTIRAQNGKRDIIRGGPGRDTAYVDRGVDDVEGVEVVVPSKPPPNNAPVAKDDSYQLSIKNCNGSQAVPLTVDAPNGVLGNDTDADADRLKAVEVTPPTHGSILTLNADGSFTYEAADGVCPDPDSFTYKTTDGATDGNVATVSLNPPPTSRDHRSLQQRTGQ